MIHSIAEFEKLAFRAIEVLSYEQKCIYCAWCIYRLHTSYAPLLAERFGPKAAAHTKACKDHLLSTIQGGTFIIDKWYWDQHRIQRIDIELELGVLSSEDCAIRALMEAIDDTFKFMATKNSDFIMPMPLLSIEIIHTILSNEYGFGTCDIDDLIGHELLQKELEEQLEVLNGAKGYDSGRFV